MFDKVLVANRGEIAVRVMRTLREMDIASVAVFSEADAGALHVANADEAVCLGDAAPGSSYLAIDRVVAAALATGAEAVHPGYGFNSENPAFARAVADAGLVFIGPPPDAMALLGDKTAARRLMAGSGVPVIPGLEAPEPDVDRLSRAAETIGFPVLIKAAMGGGGKGMRVVREISELRAAARAAASEAGSAFGDSAIYLEKYLDRPRHVEFQVLADVHGNIVHLHERECSIQRRHQKIVEETPSPALDRDLRERMGAAAVAAARAAGYVNAGTVEFLLDREGGFWFLEVNTRLQVEHPITEMVTGIDLVRCQVEVAAGLPLRIRQEDIAPRGHAIECRIYAEDPANGFMPCPGRVVAAATPEGPGIRYDSGIFTGADVPVYYDPILAKLIAHAETRDAAIARMERALEDCVVLGVATPIEFLLAVLRSDAFRSGDTHTGFIDEHLRDWKPGPEGDRMALIGYALERGRGSEPTKTGDAPLREDDPGSPWQRLGARDLL